MDKDKWINAISFLRENILHDEDFTFTDLINRRISDPEGYETICERMAIDPTYFDILHIEDRDNSSELYDLAIEIEKGLKLAKFQLKIKSWYKKRNDAAQIIQTGCYNWVWKTLCKDNKVGIRPRLDYKIFTEFVNNRNF